MMTTEEVKVLNMLKELVSILIEPVVERVVKAALDDFTPIVNTKKDQLSIKEAMEEYGISSSTIYRRFDNGMYTRIKDGGKTFLLRSELDARRKPQLLAAIDRRDYRNHESANRQYNQDHSSER